MIKRIAVYAWGLLSIWAVVQFCRIVATILHTMI